MADPGGPQRQMLCFLSTLLSQKVPEKSDAALRCVIAGQPKPEVTWYKNGQAIEERGGIVSSYEFFENQYIHLLHLSCCAQSDAAVYQVSAKSCVGMICCSASIEVGSPAESPRRCPDLDNGRDTGWKCGTQTYEEESTTQMHEEEQPYEEEESVFTGAPTTADSYPPQFNHLLSPQISASCDTHASSSENPPDVKGARQTAEAYDSNNTGFLNSKNTPEKQDLCRPVHSTVSWLVAGGLSNGGLHGEDFTSRLQNSKAQKYISFSLPLSEGIMCIYPGDSALVTKQLSPQVPSEDSDSDYELCPEITRTYMEEFSDDDLEYLECSDVMTDYSNAVWQRSLQGTEHVFLLESDDEEMEFSECGLGGCEHFLSEMGCGPLVSGDTGPMYATTGFCGHYSQPQEVGIRCSSASVHSPSSPHVLGPHQDGPAMVTGPGSCCPLTVSEAAENDCPGTQGETRDSHRAGEKHASDSLLTTGKAATEAEVKPSSGGLDMPGRRQRSDGSVEERPEEKHSGGRRGAQGPSRARRPGMKGKARKLMVKEGAPESSLSPTPRGPAKHPLGCSNQREPLHTKAGAPSQDSHFSAGQCAISRPAAHCRRALCPSADSLSKEGDTSFKGEGMRVNNLFETSQVLDQSDHPQVQIQDTVRERGFPSHLPAFSEPAGEVSPLTRTTTNSFSNLGEIHRENVSLAQYLELENCPPGPQQEDKRDRQGNMLGGPRADPEHQLRAPKVNGENMSQAGPPVHLPWDASADGREPEALSVASPGPTDLPIPLGTVLNGPRGRAVVCVMEHCEAGDQGACYDPMDPPVAAPVGKYLPQEICSVDFELMECQSKACDVCSPDGKTLPALRTQGSEPPLPTCESSRDRNVAMPPLFISTFTWNVSQKASQGVTGENLAEVENSSSVLSSTLPAGWERPSPGYSVGTGDTQSPSSENNSFVHFKEVSDSSPRTSVPVAMDTPAGHSSAGKSPQEKPTPLTANVECLQVTGEVENTSVVATKVHPAKYHLVSLSGNNCAGGAEERSPEAPGENHLQFPSDVQPGHILNGSATESPKKPLCLAPSVLGVPGHFPLLAEGENFCSNSLLPTRGQPMGRSEPVDKADNRSLEEDFQEKGSEAKQRIQPESPTLQGSLSVFQEISPTTSATQEEAHTEPLAYTPADSREETGHSSGLRTGVSEVAEASVEGESQVPSDVPSLSGILLGESADPGLGYWEAGSKVKIITLEASVPELWPPRQGTDPECKEAEAGPGGPGLAWALSANVKSLDVGPEQNAWGTAAWAHSPQAEAATALANDRETHEGDMPTSDAHWSRFSPPRLSQLRLPGSCVDPVEEREFCVSRSLSEDFLRENARQDQEKAQPEAAWPALLDRFLTFPGILESSVHPTDETSGRKHSRAEATLTAVGGWSKSTDGNLGQRVAGRPAILQAAGLQDSGDTISSKTRPNQDQADGEREEAEQSRHHQAKVEARPARLAPGPTEGAQTPPSACHRSQVRVAEAERSERGRAELTFPTSPLPSCLAIMTHAPVKGDTHSSTGQTHDQSVNDFIEPKNHPHVFSDSKERGTVEEGGKHVLSSRDLTQLPCTSSPVGNVTRFSISPSAEALKMEGPQIEETKLPGSSGSPAMTLAFISGECESEKGPELVQDLCQKGSTLDSGKKSGEKQPSPVSTQTGKLPWARPTLAGSEGVKKMQDASGSGHLAEGVKKKILSKVAALRLKLEEKENVRKNLNLPKKIPKLEKSLSCSDEKKDFKKTPGKREGKAPVLLRKIQAEMFPDHSGNVKLSCQFAEIHEDSTIWWTKDSKSIAQVQRSAGDNSSVSLVIVQADEKDQGLYYCCIKNSYGKVTAEFNLTAEVLKQLSSHQNNKGCEEIEFSQLIFREDFLNDSYFGDCLRGQIATEELHFGEGVHRKAFRSTVMQGLMPVFQPGHACVLKVHNSIAHGTRNNDELVQRNYKLAAQECYVQNTARHYAKIYAAEAQPLEGFGEVPEIIPIFLIRRPENNIPYATVEEELIGEFVKYSIRDGKEINFLRRESEAGQKCCTFQHWVYQKTSGCLLVTDMQGVGMKLTDVGIATLAKGYKGFKGNCSMTFIDQFKALHQCNKYCKMLGLKSLQNNNQKPKKPSTGKSRV